MGENLIIRYKSILIDIESAHIFLSSDLCIILSLLDIEIIVVVKAETCFWDLYRFYFV
jgi:hypothetical protein